MSKKNTARKANPYAANKLKQIQFVQKSMSDVVFGAVQSGEQKNITLKGGKVITPTVAMHNAYTHVKFQWTFLVGVLCRRTNGTHFIHAKQFFNTDTHQLLHDMSADLYHEVKNMMDNEVNQNHHLTSFWIASPNPEMGLDNLMQAALLLLDKYRIPDNFATNHEHDVKGLENVSRSYCNTSYWFNTIDWSVFSLERVYDETVEKLTQDGLLSEVEIASWEHVIYEHYDTWRKRVELVELDDIDFTAKSIQYLTKHYKKLLKEFSVAPKPLN